MRLTPALTLLGLVLAGCSHDNPVKTPAPPDHFWTLGWTLERLYQVDASGRVEAICDLPRTGTPFLGALAAEGSHLWYAEQRVGSSTLHRITVR